MLGTLDRVATSIFWQLCTDGSHQAPSRRVDTTLRTVKASGGAEQRTLVTWFGFIVLVLSTVAAAQIPPEVPSESACQDNGLAAGYRPLNEMRLRSLQAEWTIGKKLADEVEQHVSVIMDATTTQYLNRIEQDLVRKVGLGECFTVKVIDDVSPNAYSLPGGFLYITTRLILMANTESELAAALAHETAHVSARHATRISEKRLFWGRLALAGGPVGFLLRRSLGPFLTLKLMRNSEFEADLLGLTYLSASGYDPSGLSRLLQSSFQDDNTPESLLDRLLDSHPLTTTRIKRLDNAVHARSSGQSRQIVDTDEFHNVRARITVVSKILLPNDHGEPPQEVN